MQRLSAESPLILVLDDLHWIDATSASLLFHLGRHLSGSRLLILGTYRPEEAPEAHHAMAENRNFGKILLTW